MSGRRKWLSVALVAFIAFLINFPLLNSAYEGQFTPGPGLVITVLADVFLVAMIGLMLRFAALRVELVLRATEDLEHCPPGSQLDRISGLVYVVSGEVVEMGDDEIVLDLGDRRVRVLLDGHANPAGCQQPVRVVGYMVA